MKIGERKHEEEESAMQNVASVEWQATQQASMSVASNKRERRTVITHTEPEKKIKEFAAEYNVLQDIMGKLQANLIEVWECTPVSKEEIK